MDVSIISIGNSKGIRLSKTILEKYQMEGTIELILEKDCIILKPKNKARKGGKNLSKRCMIWVTTGCSTRMFLQMKNLKNGIKSIQYCSGQS